MEKKNFYVIMLVIVLTTACLVGCSFGKKNGTSEETGTTTEEMVISTLKCDSVSITGNLKTAVKVESEKIDKSKDLYSKIKNCVSDDKLVYIEIYYINLYDDTNEKVKQSGQAEFSVKLSEAMKKAEGKSYQLFYYNASSGEKTQLKFSNKDGVLKFVTENIGFFAILNVDKDNDGYEVENVTLEVSKPTEPVSGETKPQETVAPSKPQETVAPSKPQETAAPSKPQETAAPSKPQETVAPSKPQETAAPSKPQETVAPSKPQETAAPTKPQETAAPTKPQETTAPTKPSVIEGPTGYTMPVETTPSVYIPTEPVTSVTEPVTEAPTEPATKAEIPTLPGSGNKEKPNFSIYNSDVSVGSCRIYSIKVTNKGSYTMRVLGESTKLYNSDLGTEYDRDTNLVKTVDIPDSISYVDIAPGEEKEIAFAIVGKQTWYTRKTITEFHFSYDGVTYLCNTSCDYGTQINK